MSIDMDVEGVEIRFLRSNNGNIVRNQRCRCCNELKSCDEFAKSTWNENNQMCIPCIQFEKSAKKQNRMNSYLIDNAKWQDQMILHVLKSTHLVKQYLIPDGVVRLIQDMEGRWKNLWSKHHKAESISLLSDRIAFKEDNLPGSIRCQNVCPQGWSYFEIVIYRPDHYVTHPSHLNRHFIGVVTSNVGSFGLGLANVNPGYWGINESVNGWWFRDGQGSRAPGVKSFLEKEGQVTGVLLSTEHRKLWFFLDDKLNGTPLDSLPTGVNFFPTVLLRDQNSAVKIMFPRMYPSAVQAIIQKNGCN